MQFLSNPHADISLMRSYIDGSSDAGDGGAVQAEAVVVRELCMQPAVRPLIAELILEQTRWDLLNQRHFLVVLATLVHDIAGDHGDEPTPSGESVWQQLIAELIWKVTDVGRDTDLDDHPSSHGAPL
jgi:hypothetical protein